MDALDALFRPASKRVRAGQSLGSGSASGSCPRKGSILSKPDGRVGVQLRVTRIGSTILARGIAVVRERLFEIAVHSVVQCLDSSLDRRR